MLAKQEGPSIWDLAILAKLVGGVLRGLRIEHLEDVGLIGGGASLTTVCGDVTIKTVSLAYGAERYLHFVGVHGRLTPDDALALVDLFAGVLDVPPRVAYRRSPDRGTLLIQCDAVTEHALQNRVSLLGSERALTDALTSALQPH